MANFSTSPANSAVFGSFWIMVRQLLQQPAQHLGKFRSPLLLGVLVRHDREIGLDVENERLSAVVLQEAQHLIDRRRIADLLQLVLRRLYLRLRLRHQLLARLRILRHLRLDLHHALLHRVGDLDRSAPAAPPWSAVASGSMWEEREREKREERERGREERETGVMQIKSQMAQDPQAGQQWIKEAQPQYRRRRTSCRRSAMRRHSTR